MRGNDSEQQTITNAPKSKGIIYKLFWSSNSKLKAMFDILCSLFGLIMIHFCIVCSIQQSNKSLSNYNSPAGLKIKINQIFN